MGLFVGVEIAAEGRVFGLQFVVAIFQFLHRGDHRRDKPMFRNAFKERRCIIPASGFYEWTGPKGQRQPHLFTRADGSPVMGFAGLWERWHDRGSGDEILSYTIIVCGGVIVR